MKILITAAQCRAARALLNWSQEDLAAKCSVSRASIADFENNQRWPAFHNLNAIADCLNQAGIQFIRETSKLEYGFTIGAGVAFKETEIESLIPVRYDRSGNIVFRLSYRGNRFKLFVPIRLFLNEVYDQHASQDIAQQIANRNRPAILLKTLRHLKNHPVKRELNFLDLGD